MKIIGTLLIIGILFSYVPMISMDDCPDGDHMGNMKTDCGYCFHSPGLFGMNISEYLFLPFSGRLVLVPPSVKIDEIPFLIFHPPKFLI